MFEKYILILIFFLLTGVVMYIQHIRDEKRILENELKNQKVKTEQKINNIKIKDFEGEVQNDKRKTQKDINKTNPEKLYRRDYNFSIGEHIITF